MRVLIIEDDRSSIRTLQNLLPKPDYLIDIADSASTGLQMATAFDYGLILLNARLTQREAGSLYRRLRNQGSEAPILLLVDADGEYPIASALNDGVDDFILAPFDAKDLTTRVQALTQRRALKQQTSPRAIAPAPFPLEKLRATEAKLQQAQQALTLERQRYQALQQRDQQWRALFDQALDAIAVLDDTGQYKDVNPAACELFGVSKEELLHRNVADFARSNAGFSQAWQTFLRRGHMLGEFYVYRPDGAKRETEFTAIANFVPGLHLSILRDISERKQLEAQRQQQWERERLITEITRSIRQTLDLNQILRSAVDQVRQLLQTDRVIIFRLQSNKQGIVEAESVAPGWSSAVETVIRDSCFSDRYTDLYRQGRVSAIEDIHAARYRPCHIDLLSGFQVRANLVVPILQENDLWGLLIAHHCSGPRSWSTEHVQLLKQVAAQLGIAIQQAELYQQVRRELLERRQVQAALQESEERFRSLAAFAPIGIYQTDTAGCCLYTNSHWQAIAGLTLEESLGDGWERGIHPEDRAMVFTAWSRFVYEHRAFALEFRFLTPEGQERWVYGQATAIYSSVGEIVGYVGVNEDITERKRADAALRESESRFRHMADTAPVMVWMSGIDKRCTYFNRAWLDFTGEALEQEVGDGWTEHIHPDDYQFCTQTYSHCFDIRQPFEMEYRLRRFDGEYRWLLDCGTPRYDTDGTFLGYIGSCIDISDRIRAEQKIREQAALIDIATDAIFVRDLEDRIVFWSRGAERLYGWTSEQAVGHLSHTLIGQDERSPFEAVLALVIEHEAWQGELTQTTQAGRNIVVESRWTLMKDSAGRPQSLLVVNTDITEKKQLETQFYRTQRLESLGRLASGIAHDLNNVLTPVLAIAQILRLKQSDLDSQTDGHLALIERSAKRGANIVKQVLTFARGGDGEPTPVSLLSVLQEVVEMAQQSFPKSVEIRQQLLPVASPLLETVLADATQLHQVFTNLCINARDAMPDGGVLTISVENVTIDDAFARTNLEVEVGRYIAVTVADTGVGIASEVRDRIFEPFFTTKEIGKGTGLGLATTLGIVKHYGGFLQVFSELERGTQMKVYLPVVDSAQIKEEPQELVLGQGQLVLVVDDEAAVQRSMQSLLDNHAYTTLLASSGTEAIACYTQHQSEIQLVILDVMMPKMDGFTLIQRLREISAEIKIMAISGLATNREAALSAGADVFMPKPYTLDDLLQRVSFLLSH